MFKCRVDDSGNQICGNTSFFPVFSDYTSTDILGIQTGLYDSTDWVNDTNWLICEENLFPQFQNLTKGFEKYSNIQISPAFPNPTNSSIIFNYSKESDVRFSFRIVNKNLKIIRSLDSIYNNSVLINVKDVVSASDKIVRIYYFLNEMTVVCIKDMEISKLIKLRYNTILNNSE